MLKGSKFSPDEHSELGPGLHQVGPNPWDYVYNPAKGQRINFVGRGGATYNGTITEFTKNNETGEISLTIQ